MWRRVGCVGSESPPPARDGCGVQGVARVTGAVRPARSDLHPHEHVPRVDGHDVELAITGPRAAAENDPAVQGQPFGDPGLRAPAEVMSRVTA